MAKTSKKTAPAAAAKPTQSASAPNAKAVKFVELAEKRVTKAINAIRSVSKLSNRNNYVFSDAQVTKISEVLRDEVLAMNEQFSSTPTTKEGFKL